MADQSILNENYQENPEVDYMQGAQYERNISLFRQHNTRVLWHTTEAIYKYIRDLCIDYVKNHPQYPKFIWKPKICDVGCGGGFGSNILSQEADFVWGIDKDEASIKWAKIVFERQKNNIYYSSQLSFEVIDILNEPREIMAFDIIACVEVIEHLQDYEKLLAFLKRLCKKDKEGRFVEPPNASMVFISSPNRNNPKIQKDKPKNPLHVREWTAEELYILLSKHFKYVVLMDWQGTPCDLNTTSEVILFKCETPVV